jgi:hypothetical protein
MPGTYVETANIKLKKPDIDAPRWQQWMNENLDLIDQLLQGLITTGPYNSIWKTSTAYVVDDRVLDVQLGVVYVCLVGHTSAASGTFAAYRVANPTHWTSATVTAADALTLGGQNSAFYRNASNLNAGTVADARLNSTITRTNLTATGVVTGDDVIAGSNGSTTPLMEINGIAGVNRMIRFRTAGTLRWQWGADATAEGGANAGSDWALYRYADGGTLLDTPMTVLRSNGRLSLVNQLLANGGIAATGAVTAGTVTATGAVTGNQVVASKASGDVAVDITSAVANQRNINFFSGVSLRWRLSITSEAESGSNAGSNMTLASYTDAGGLLHTALSINRATGVANFAQPITRATLNVHDDGSVAELPFRNKLINSDFFFWQRGTSIGPVATTNFLADRWQAQADTSTYVYSRQAHAAGQDSQYFARFLIASSAGVARYALVAQKIPNLRQFSNKKVSVRIRAKADAARPIAVELVELYGTGGVPSVSTFPSYSKKVTLSTSFTDYKFENIQCTDFTGKTFGTAGDDALQVVIWFDAGSNYNARTDTLGQQSGTFDIARIQVEIGEKCTPFEIRDRGLEFAMCRRFYRTQGYGDPGIVSTVTSLRVFKRFDDPMFQAPAITLLDTTPGILTPAGTATGVASTLTSSLTSTYGYRSILGGFAALTVGDPIMLNDNEAIALDAEF